MSEFLPLGLAAQTFLNPRKIMVAISRDFLEEAKPPRIRRRSTLRKCEAYRHMIRGAFHFDIWTADRQTLVSSREVPLHIGNDRKRMEAWRDIVRFDAREDTWVLQFFIPSCAAPAGPYIVYVWHRKIIPFWVDAL